MNKLLSCLILALLCISGQARAVCTLNNVTGSSGTSGGGLGPTGYITDIVGNGTSLLAVTYTPNIGSPTTSNINFSSTGTTITGSWHGTKLTSYSAAYNSGTGTSDLSINSGAGHLFFSHTAFIGSGSFSGTNAGATKVYGGGVQLLDFDGWSSAAWVTQAKKVLGDCSVTASYGYNTSNQFALSATAVDAASVDFYWDGSLVAHDTSAPFTATASLQEGHTFTVTANWANGSLSYDYTSQWGGQHLPMLRSGLYTNCMSFAGKAYCWGSGAYGAIGDGNGTVDRSTPYAISELAVNTTSIAMLADGACATHSGSAYCWGKNDNGVVGLNPATDPSTAWPNPIVLVGTYVEVGAGDDFACFRTSGGALDCIGSGSVGQMGNGGTTATNYAMVSTYASGVKRVAAGGDTACVITSSDRVECWGRDGRGQAGNGGTAATYIASPADVGLSSVVDIAVGYRHACALNSSGTVYCWGDNSCGQIGIGSSDASVHVSPVSATSLTALGVSRLFSGRNYNTCVVTSAGAMKCVGENTLGELGTGATSSCEVMPVTVSGFTSGVVGGAIGGADGAAFRNGHVYYFGDNTYTEIGNASASNPQLTPIQVTGF